MFPPKHRFTVPLSNPVSAALSGASYAAQMILGSPAGLEAPGGHRLCLSFPPQVSSIVPGLHECPVDVNSMKAYKLMNAFCASRCGKKKDPGSNKREITPLERHFACVYEPQRWEMSSTCLEAMAVYKLSKLNLSFSSQINYNLAQK